MAGGSLVLRILQLGRNTYNSVFFYFQVEGKCYLLLALFTIKAVWA